MISAWPFCRRRECLSESGPRLSDMCGALQDVLLRTLAVRLAAKHADIGSREIATLAWSLAKLKVTGQHAEMWHVLEEIMCARGCCPASPHPHASTSRRLCCMACVYCAAASMPFACTHLPIFPCRPPALKLSSSVAPQDLKATHRELCPLPSGRWVSLCGAQVYDNALWGSPRDVIMGVIS